MCIRERLRDVTHVADELDQREGGMVSGLRDALRVDGKQYGLPWFSDAVSVYYRTDIFEAAGIPLPDTYDEVLDLSLIHISEPTRPN